MALFAGSGGGGARARVRRLLRVLRWPLATLWAGARLLTRALRPVGRVLGWPLAKVWAGVGLLTKVALDAAGRAWSLVRRAPPGVDALLAMMVFAFVVGATPQRYSNPQMLVIAAQVLPLAVVRRSPVGAALTMAASNLLGLFTIDYYPFPSIIALVFVVGVVANRLERTAAAQVAAVAGLALLAALRRPDFQPQGVAFLLFAILVAVMFGANLRSRREAESGLVLAEEQRAQEATQRAVLEERSRIARELHDVVAHHMSLVAVQSQSAPRRIADLPPEGVADFDEINTAARNALAEMRRVLAVLRDDRDGAERAPQPGVDALPALISGAEQAGQTVDLQVTGEPRPLPGAVDVSIYRIAQEALTNVRRHAQVTAASLTVAYLPTAVRVRVTDRGIGDRADDARPGQGLVGMRERVTMLGGTFRAGNREDGGYEVEAVLPTSDEGDAR